MPKFSLKNYPWFSVEHDFLTWLGYTGVAFGAWGIIAYEFHLPSLLWVWLLVLLYHPIESNIFYVYGADRGTGYRWYCIYGDGFGWIALTALVYMAWAVIAYTFGLPYLTWCALLMLTLYPLEDFVCHTWGEKFEGGPIP